MTNIILPAQVKGRYVRITPTGLLSASPGVGNVAGLTIGGVTGRNVSGVAEVAASTAFTLSAIEVYAFNNSVFFKVEGAGKVEMSNKAITSATYANNRVATVGDSQTITFKCVPDNKASRIRVLRGNEDISSMVAPDGTVTLTNVSADTDITVSFANQ